MSSKLKPVEPALAAKEIFLNNAKRAKLRPNKAPNKCQYQDEPQFDKECRDIRNNL